MYTIFSGLCFSMRPKEKCKKIKFYLKQTQKKKKTLRY